MGKKKGKEPSKYTYVDIMPWAGIWPWSRRCKSRLKRGQDPAFYGRCELAPHEDMFEHCLERGMIWVRWHERTGIYYTDPEYKRMRN